MRTHYTRGASWVMICVGFLSLGSWLQAGEGRRKPKSEAAAAAKTEADRPAEKQYWIGVMGTAVDPLLKTHLKIDSGVVVQHVVPDSPAAKAGIQENDIVLKFGAAQATDAAELAKAVNENKDQVAKVLFLREGRETVADVTPAPRPAESEIPALRGGARERIGEWLKELEKGRTDEPFRMFFFRPGLVMPEDGKGRVRPGVNWPKIAVQMPKNMSVTVTKRDDGPAQIVVKQGDKSWEVKEDELDKLPEDARKAVQGMLGGNLAFPLLPHGGPWLGWGESWGGLPGDAKAKTETGDVEDHAKRQLDDMLKKMDDIKREMQDKQDRLQQELEKLRHQLDRPSEKAT